MAKNRKYPKAWKVFCQGTESKFCVKSPEMELSNTPQENKGVIAINTIYKQAAIIQQIALNNKMLEKGYIEKVTHAQTHRTLLKNLANYTQ